MRTSGPRAFWLSFFVTMMVLLPLIGAVVYWGAWQNQGVEPADRQQSGIPVRSPGGEHAMNILAVVAGQSPAFLLLRLDALENQITLAALPAETVLVQGQGTVQLSQCYETAGPARAAALLEQTLNIRIHRYLGISRENLGRAMQEVGSARVNLTSLLTESQRIAAGFGGPVQEFTPATAAEFLKGQTLPPMALARLRSAVWEAFVRQDLEYLPGAVPPGLRRVSSTLLTNLTALDLYTLAETLEFLADREGSVEQTALPARWDVKTACCELEPEAPAWAARHFGGAIQPVYDPLVPIPTRVPMPSPTLAPPAMAGGL